MGYIYKVDHDYFQEIDSEYKAYILGFIYADGCISESKGNRQMRMTIAIQEEDGYILKKLANEAGGKEVYRTHSPSSQIKGWKSKSVVSITSNKLCKDLIDLGCNIRKSQVGMTFPNLKPEFISHFIRGFLDGDGSVILKKLNYKYKRKTTHFISNAHKDRYKIQIAFCSTDKKFLERIIKELNLKSYRIDSKLRKQIVYILWIENKSETRETWEYLYKNANFFLKRKRDKIEQYNMTIKSEAENTFSERLETT